MIVKASSNQELWRTSIETLTSMEWRSCVTGKDPEQGVTGKGQGQVWLSQEDRRSIVAAFTANLNLHGLAELLSKGDTSEVMAVSTVVDRCYIEEDDEQGKEADRGDQTDDDANDLAASVQLIEGDVWQKGKREQEAEDEADQVGVVVDERQQADQEQHHNDGHEFEHGTPGRGQDVPIVQDLYDQASEQAKLGTSWTCFHMVGQKDGAGKAACYPWTQVDDGNAQPTSQLLQVAHHEELEEDADDQLEEASMHKKGQPQPVELVWAAGLQEWDHAADLIHAAHLWRGVKWEKKLGEREEAGDWPGSRGKHSRGNTPCGSCNIHGW